MFNKFIKKIYNQTQKDKPIKRNNSLNVWNLIYYL